MKSVRAETCSMQQKVYVVCNRKRTEQHYATTLTCVKSPHKLNTQPRGHPQPVSSDLFSSEMYKDYTVAVVHEDMPAAPRRQKMAASRRPASISTSIHILFRRLSNSSYSPRQCCRIVANISREEAHDELELSGDKTGEVNHGGMMMR